MLKNKKYIIGILTFLLIIFIGCYASGSFQSRIELQNNQGIFFNTNNELFPIYYLQPLDTSDLIVRGLEEMDEDQLDPYLLGEFFTINNKGFDIPINEIKVGNQLKIYLNKNFEKPLLLHIIYENEFRTAIIPFEWTEGNYIQFDIINLEKDMLYTFQVTYARQEEGIIRNFETYLFRAIFK
ncbi:MAG: hypothetical protein ACK5G7_04470 [Erysipelotrichaceae bacterium]